MRFLAFFANGMCSIVQKMQQIAFAGACKNKFMTLALLMVTLVLGILAISRERGQFRSCISAGFIPVAACGICNGATNLLVMVLNGILATLVLFLAICAGGIILAFVCSVFLYKEPFLLCQGIGVAFGIAAVVLSL